MILCPTILFDSDLSLSSTATGGSPKPFDVSVVGETSFFFVPGGGDNLLLDVTIADGPPTTIFDAEFVMGDSVSRVLCDRDPQCLVTDTAVFNDTLGLVTQFLPGEVFGDGFESGDTSAWSSSVP